MADVDTMSVIGAVICQELYLDTDDIEVETDLRQCGLNSLTAMMITVKLLEEHNIDLGPGILKENHSLYLLRKALHRKSLSAVTPLNSIPEAESTDLATTKSTDPTSSSETNTSATSSSDEVAATPSTVVSQSDSLALQVMYIVAEEMNIDQSEFADSVEWANLGLDSIMSLTICSRLREELDMEVESTIFAEYDSVGAFKKHLSQRPSSG